MIVVKIELHSAITRQMTEIARAVIYNDGTGTDNRGNYGAFSCRGRSKEALHNHMSNVLGQEATGVHEGQVKNHDRNGLHVLHLVAKALTAMGYGK